MNIVDYADREMLALAVADRLVSDLKTALLHHDCVTLAVPGGTSPGPIFDVMSAVALDWDRVSVMLTDERWVPEGHERSNTTLVKSRLLKGAAAAAGFVPFVDEGTPEEVCAQKSVGMAALLPISVMLLGMGEDMHTASLFPDAPGLDAALAPDAPALCVVKPDSQPDARVSLAGHVIAGALAKHLVIYGAAKRTALERAKDLAPEVAPIHVAMTDLTVHWAE